MDDDINPQAIFIVITVFILFINKVVEMMKERKAEKASRRARQETVAKAPPQPRRPPLQSTRRQVGQRPTQTTSEPPLQRQQPPQSPLKDVLTELFEAAGVPTQQSSPPEPPTPTRQPPPIPGTRRSTIPKLTKAEREALDRLESRNERSTVNRRRIRRESAGKIAKLLLSQDAARQSIVVAEILGPPRAFRELEER